MQKTTAAIATTKNESNQIRHFVPTAAPIFVILIGVAPIFRNKFNRVALRKALGFHHPLLVFAGRLEKSKGIYTLLDAFKQLVKREESGMDTKLIIAGGEEREIDYASNLPYKEKLLKAVEDLSTAMEAVIENDFLAKRLSRQAIHFAERTFQWSTISKKMNHLYEEVLEFAPKRHSSSGYRFGRDISG